MIKNIYIKDFAIIDEINLPFKDGLTVITGETGSGKSILLQALNVSLGGKITKTMVRSDAEKAIVETEVNAKSYRRLINPSGRARSFINAEPLTENNYRAECYSLADFHGQHEQQIIMNENSHIDYLDAFGNLGTDVAKCTNRFDAIKKTEKHLSELIEKKQNALQYQELLSFQLNEISSINPELNEDIALENELSTLKNLDELVETANMLSIELTDDDDSIYNRISIAQLALDKLSNFDEKIGEYSELIKSASINVQDVSAGLTDHINSLNHDKNRLVEIQDRLGVIDNLKRKYGGSIEAIQNTKIEIEQNLSDYTSLDEQIIQVQKKVEQKKVEYKKLALSLHERRLKGGKHLSKAIESEMSKLNMPGAKFEIQITQKPDEQSFVIHNYQLVTVFEKGIDIVRFMLSANPGEKLKPLVEIASGGEISRIMLAIKTVFHNNDPVYTLIFDEIDSGISGDAAEKVSQSLLNLAKSKQVICITHLPQIAKSAMHHLHVTKSVKEGKTFVDTKYLDESESKAVIYQLSAGSQ